MVLWILLGVALTWGVAGLVMCSDGGISVYDLFFLIYGGLALVIVALALFIALCVRGGKLKLRVVHYFPLPYGLLLVVLVVVVIGVVSNAPFLVRFEMSRTALQAKAAQVRAGATPQTPTRVGYFNVREIDQAGDSVRFITAKSMLDHSGVVYCPSGSPRRVGEDTYWHVHGPWWGWYRSW